MHIARGWSLPDGCGSEGASGAGEAEEAAGVGGVRGGVGGVGGGGGFFLLGESEPVLEGAGPPAPPRKVAGEGGVEEVEEGVEGEVLFAEADAGVGGGGEPRASARSLGFGWAGVTDGWSVGGGVFGVVRVGEGIGVVGGLDVDEVEAGGVAVVDELAEADFGGFGDEADHGFGDEDAGEDDAEEGADEAGAGVGW